MGYAAGLRLKQVVADKQIMYFSTGMCRFLHRHLFDKMPDEQHFENF